MTSLAKLRDKLLSDPVVKAEYDRLGPIFAVVGEMAAARQAAGLTQAGTKPPGGCLAAVPSLGSRGFREFVSR